MNTKQEIENAIQKHKNELLKIIEDEKDVNLYSIHLLMKMCSDYDYVIDQI